MSSNLGQALVSLVFLAIAPTATSALQFEGEGQKAGYKVVIRDLKRDEGGTVTLRFQVQSQHEKPLATYLALGGLTPAEAVQLIDPAGKKKYLPVKDASGKCACSDEAKYTPVSKDASVNLWAKFPAPPDSVQKISVVIAGFDPIESVPIAGR